MWHIFIKMANEQSNVSKRREEFRQVDKQIRGTYPECVIIGFRSKSITNSGRLLHYVIAQDPNYAKLLTDRAMDVVLGSVIQSGGMTF